MKTEQENATLMGNKNSEHLKVKNGNNSKDGKTNEKIVGQKKCQKSRFVTLH